MAGKHQCPEEKPVPSLCYNVREPPMSRREACPYSLLLVSDYKSASSDPVGSCDIITGRQEVLGLLPGPAEEAFISVPLLGTERLNHLFYLHLSPGLMLSCLYNPGLPVQSHVACSNFPQLSAQPATSTVKEAAWLLWNFYKTKYVHRERLLNYSHFTFNHHV